MYHRLSKGNNNNITTKRNNNERVKKDSVKDTNDNIKKIYSTIKNSNFQKEHPFGGSDLKKVNYWGVPPGQEERPLTQRNSIKYKDNLEKGIAYYINTKEVKSSSHSKSRNSSVKTERVLNPSLNTEYYEEINGHHRKKFNSGRTQGSINELIMKTPDTYFPLGGRKRSNYSAEKYTNIFDKDFLMDNTNRGLFGVMRKVRKNHILTNENKVYDDLPHGKKHYHIQSNSIL